MLLYLYLSHSSSLNRSPLVHRFLFLLLLLHAHFIQLALTISTIILLINFSQRWTPPISIQSLVQIAIVVVQCQTLQTHPFILVFCFFALSAVFGFFSCYFIFLLLIRFVVVFIWFQHTNRLSVNTFCCCCRSVDSSWDEANKCGLVWQSQRTSDFRRIGILSTWT